VESAERILDRAFSFSFLSSFFKSKLIETYNIRSTMLQERLAGLAIISIEPDYASSLDAEELVAKVSKPKAREMRF